MNRTTLVFFGIIAVVAGVVIATFLLKPGPQVVTGLSGSEKEAFFDDTRVQKRLQELGLSVKITKAGSREIATAFDLNQYDFGFPAGTPATEKIQTVRKGSLYEPFYTPMVIATFTEVSDLLVAQGIAKNENGYYLLLDLKKFFDLISDKQRWSDLPNNQAYSVNRDIMITTTDVRKSNSAAMYLSLMSYIINDNQIVRTMSEIQPELPQLSDLFLRQGLPESSSSGPFENYLSRRLGYAPMVLIYESQFLAEKSKPTNNIAPNMVLMYPQPTIYTQHTLVAFTEGGKKLGEALTNDPQLQSLAIEYGFRTRDVNAFANYALNHNVHLPAELINVIDPPSYEVLEGMIQSIEAEYQK